MTWQSRHRNKADGDDVISARPFVVLADIFIMLFALFLVMPFFMYLNAQRARDYDALETLKGNIKRPTLSDVDYDKLARDILKAASNKRAINQRGTRQLRTNDNDDENPILKEKYRVGDLIRFRLEATKEHDPFVGDGISDNAKEAIQSLARLVRPFGTLSKNKASLESKSDRLLDTDELMLLTRQYKNIDEFLTSFDLRLQDLCVDTDVTRIDKNRLWQDHVIQEDRKGVIKRITIEGHGYAREKPEKIRMRAETVALFFQQAADKEFVYEEVEITTPIKPDPAKQRPYVDITLVFNQDFATLFKEKVEYVRSKRP